MVLGFCVQNGLEFIYEWSGKEDLKFKIMDNEEEYVVILELELVVVSEKIEVGLVIVVVSVSMKYIEIVF